VADDANACPHLQGDGHAAPVMALLSALQL